MARYEVAIRTTLTHIIAVEANDVIEAQALAMREAAEGLHMPLKMDSTIEVEVGN